jgi:hypothetical protein
MAGDVQPAPEQQFSSSARWIWDPTGQYQAWWMFRKTVRLPTAGIRAATLLVTSCQYHIAYVNGQIVDRGPAPSYDFAKHYSEVDITHLLVPGEHCSLAVLSHEIREPSSPAERPTQGLLIELIIQPHEGPSTHIASDRTWKVRRHPSFREDVPGDVPGDDNFMPMQGPEEWFDARSEPSGWTSSGFDDLGWRFAREFGPPGFRRGPASRSIVLPLSPMI